jgi:hypothetical protein
MRSNLEVRFVGDFDRAREHAAACGSRRVGAGVPEGSDAEDLVRVLNGLGVDVRDGNAYRSFATADHGGHGANPEIKQVYVRKMLDFSRQNEAELADYSREPQ